MVFAAGPVRAAAPNASTPSARVEPSSRPTRRSPSACGEHDDQLDRGRPARGRPRCDTPVPASQNRGRPPPSGQRTGLPDRARQLTETLTPAEFHDRQYPDTLTDEPGTGQVRLPTELGGRGQVPRDDVAAPRRRSSRYSTPPRRVTPNTTVNEPPDDGSSTTTRYAQATQQPTTAPSQQPDALSSAASCLRSPTVPAQIATGKPAIATSGRRQISLPRTPKRSRGGVRGLFVCRDRSDQFWYTATARPHCASKNR